MKLTNQRLKKIIKEELQSVLELRQNPSTVPPQEGPVTAEAILQRLKVQQGINLENRFLKRLAHYASGTPEALKAWMKETCAVRGEEKGGNPAKGGYNAGAAYAIESVMRALVDIGGQQAGQLLLDFPGCSGAGRGMR